MIRGGPFTSWAGRLLVSEDMAANSRINANFSFVFIRG
jgi:hypothetical protein